jgi:hypothetical protein
MERLVQYQIVRVVKLLGEPEQYHGWKLNRRPPAVGDTGTLLNVLCAPGLRDRYVVECCEPDGTTVWLGDFDAAELQPAQS